TSIAAGTISTGTGLTVSNTGSASTLVGVIVGAGGLTKAGAGTLTLAGSAANTYGGLTRVNDGILELSKAGTNAVGGGVLVGDNTGAAQSAVLRHQADNQIPNASAVTVNSDGVLDLNFRTEAVGVLSVNDGLVNAG